MDCLDRLIFGALDSVQGKDSYVEPFNAYITRAGIAPPMDISALGQHFALSAEISSRILDLVQATQYWKVAETIQCYSLGSLPGRGREWLVERSNQVLAALKQEPKMVSYETPVDVFRQILREEAKGAVLVVSNLFRIGMDHSFYSTRARINGCFEREMVRDVLGLALQSA